MKKKIFLFSMVLMLLTSVVAVGCAAPAPSPAKPIELSFSIPFPAPYPGTVKLQDWAAEVESRTNGKVKITTYVGGTLVSFPEVYDGVISGIADIGTGIFGYTPGRFPLMEFFDLPLWLPSGQVASQAAYEAIQNLDPQEITETKVLFVFTPTVNIIASTKKPIRTLEDFEGIQLRCTGGATTYVKALGATPVHMPQGDVYDALAKGIVDATVVSPDVLKGYKQAEVVDYVTKTNLPSTLFFTTMNPGKWNALPKDIQKVIEEISQEWVIVMGQCFDDMGAEGLRYAVEEEGCELITPTPAELARWKEQLKPVVEERITELEAKGISAREWVDEILRLAEKYSK